MSVMSATRKDDLVNDVDAVIQDAEELLAASANRADEGSIALRERVRRRLERTKAELHDLQHAAVDKAKAAGRRTDDFVHDHPWESVGIAAGIGLLLGMLISRR